jgi:hypothetical protein
MFHYLLSIKVSLKSKLQLETLTWEDKTLIIILFNIAQLNS